MSDWRVSIADKASPMVNQAVDGLSDVRELNRFVGERVKSEVRDYLILLGNTRHDTADRLGGKYTHFLSAAAEQTSMESDNAGATVSVASPGMHRAFSDVLIKAGTQTPGVRYLTIPLAGVAYGNRIGKGKSWRFPGGFFFTSKLGNLLYARRVGKGKDSALELLYLLRESVLQKQDRTLLPSDQQITTAAIEGVADYVEFLTKRAGGAA